MGNYKEQLIELKKEVKDCAAMLSLAYEGLLRDVDLVHVYHVFKIVHDKLEVIIKKMDEIM